MKITIPYKVLCDLNEYLDDACEDYGGYATFDEFKSFLHCYIWDENYPDEAIRYVWNYRFQIKESVTEQQDRVKRAGKFAEMVEGYGTSTSKSDGGFFPGTLHT